MAGSWQPADDAELWCAGMRLESRRTLSADERAAMEQRAGRSLGRWTMAVSAVPVVLALPFVLASMLGPRFDAPVGTAIGIVTFIVWIGAIPVLLMAAHDQWRSRARLLRDRDHGEALVFTGRPDPEVRSEGHLDPLLRPVDIMGEDVSDQRLEVLPESRVAVTFEPGGALRLVPVVLVEVAAAPTYALRLPIPAEWRGTDPEPGREFLRRALNDAERSEIETMIRRLRRPHVGTVVVAIFGFLACVSRFQGFEGNGRGGEHPASLLFMMSVGVYVVIMYARSVSIARRLKRDAEGGIVITARPEPPPEPETSHPADDEPAATIEFLPFSQLVWNRDGRPAAWRQLRRAA